MSEPEVSLYERIGGEEGVKKMVDAFYERVFADEMLGPFFENASREKLLRMQVEFFSAALDGPIEYAGLSLAHAHHGRGIGRKHFARFVECLLETLKETDLSPAEARDVVDRVNTYLTDITGATGMAG